MYRKNPKNLEARKNYCNYPKTETKSFYYRVMGPKDADGMSNRVDPDPGAVWSGLHYFRRTICPKT